MLSNIEQNKTRFLISLGFMCGLKPYKVQTTGIVAQLNSRVQISNLKGWIQVKSEPKTSFEFGHA